MLHAPVRKLRDSSLFDQDSLRLFANLPDTPTRQIEAVLLPHIYRGWGAATYRAAAAALRASPSPEVVYIFGFKHDEGTGVLFHGTRRSYDLGYREIAVCQHTLTLLESALGSELYRFEADHDSDWTIENALPALVSGCGEFATFVPILVDYDSSMFQPGTSAYLQSRAFIGAISESIRYHHAAGRRTLLAAAVDLSHIGRFFGDPRVTSARDQEVREFERRYLQHVMQIDPENAELCIGKNVTRSDAPGPVGLLLRVLQEVNLASRGELLHYEVYHGQDYDRWVSLAAGVFV